MTFRAIRILREVDIIAAEDTRHTRKLLTHFDIHTPLIRFDENCKTEVGEKILTRLQNGESVAVVSDAGLPAISDPGADLVRLAADAGITVCPIPGANAALSALICSGLDTTKFTFVGFPPKTKKNRREFLEKLSAIDNTLIFYEAPHHLINFLDELTEIFGDRRAVLARELTKVHEEFIRDNLRSLTEKISEPLGEFVIVVEGNKTSCLIEKPAATIPEVMEKFLAEGLDKKSAMRETAKLFNVSRRDIYNSLLKDSEEV
ncbi:MAG: 16S rRNA (cytidine(1402)-2'-O)-methyltransferase [Selenomonadaceae bacterium]|nr:16S rRNA (cytidine(1402)-2'-O)-methyltransferase [Selenomonadaceae bacterium]